MVFCKQNDILCIADEVMTGFGKTGKYFASEYMVTKPDIMCLSKALTAGFVPMAITTCTQKIYSAFLSDSMDTAFLHAHTYSANPIACSAALAGIELMQSTEIQENIETIISSHIKFDKKICNHPLVSSTRQLGVIYAFDMDIDMQRYGHKRDEIFNFFMHRGVFLRPLGNTVYILPPFIIKTDELNKIYDVIIELLETVSKT
ncbi:MAG: aminotransferase class III-fold pyridoxal phosphate-dependent enzyme [Alcanivoracaceae bacterium]|nr:aminotransferase class III-fold pyridoxal phosphate-dependent enzyme [Alcanivoracaceae bacterium]